MPSPRVPGPPLRPWPYTALLSRGEKLYTGCFAKTATLYLARIPSAKIDSTLVRRCEETSTFISRRRSRNGGNSAVRWRPLLRIQSRFQAGSRRLGSTHKFHSSASRERYRDDRLIEGSRVRGILLEFRRRLGENSTNTPCVDASCDIECERLRLVRSTKNWRTRKRRRRDRSISSLANKAR